MRRFLVVVMLFFSFSCSKHAEYVTQADTGTYGQEQSVEIEKAEVPTKSSEGNAEEVTPAVQPKIIKDGVMELRVTDLTKAKMRVDTLVAQNGGYYGSEDFRSSASAPSFVMTIRVPNKNFERLIQGLESGEGSVKYKTIQARDVTDQFIDLESRLANKQSYLERYRALLKQAHTIKEILEIETEIRALEEEIESTTGRLKYLGDRVSFSTLELTLSTPHTFRFEQDARDPYVEKLKEGLFKGWYGFVDFTLLLSYLWPLFFVLGLAIYLWKRSKRRKAKK